MDKAIALKLIALFMLYIRVRRSFSVEAKRSEKKAKHFSLRSEKMSFFRMFRFEAKHWKSQAKRKRTKQKKQCKTKKNRKNCETKMPHASYGCLEHLRLIC
jgi:hypothetical protein